MTAGDTPSAFSGQVAEFYDGHTSGADELPTYFRRCATFQVRPDLKGKALNVLELGCGNGRLSVFLATEYGFNMTAVDVSTQAIQAAQDNARRHGRSEERRVGNEGT